jgi:hypothetical protein
LRRERACWVLGLRHGGAQLKHEVGLGYVACLLSQSDELVPSAALFSRFSAGRRKNLCAADLPDPETGLPIPLTDGVGIAQLPPGQDEAEARSRYRAQLAEYRETMEDPTVPESERAEAQRAYDELHAFLEQHYRPGPDAGHAVTSRQRSGVGVPVRQTSISLKRKETAAGKARPWRATGSELPVRNKRGRKARK